MNLAKILLTWIVGILVFSQSTAHGSQCEILPSKVVVRFINGVWNTHEIADDNLRNLWYALGLARPLAPQPGFDGSGYIGGIPVEAQLSFNASGGKLDDVVEAIQGSAALDPALKDRYDLIQSAFDAYLTNANPSLYGINNTIIQAIDSYFRASFKKSMDEMVLQQNASFEATLNEIDAQIQADLGSGAAVLVVAHSEGNIFAERLKQRFSSATNRVMYLHVAPPNSISDASPYLLNPGDYIVNNLARTGGFNPPVPNTDSVAGGDNSHAFIQGYIGSGSKINELVSEQVIKSCGPVVRRFLAKTTSRHMQTCDRGPGNPPFDVTFDRPDVVLTEKRERPGEFVASAPVWFALWFDWGKIRIPGEMIGRFDGGFEMRTTIGTNTISSVYSYPFCRVDYNYGTLAKLN